MFSMEKVQKKNMKESINFRHPVAQFFLLTLYGNSLRDNFSNTRNLSRMAKKVEKISVNQIKSMDEKK